MLTIYNISVPYSSNLPESVASFLRLWYDIKACLSQTGKMILWKDGGVLSRLPMRDDDEAGNLGCDH